MDEDEREEHRRGGGGRAWVGSSHVEDRLKHGGME